ncbi:Rdx family-domain-containing protein [Hypoxylon sp. FL1284]|nr:Rdx family-domain-containing protein [Hypoxylon sp. FL1284]
MAETETKTAAASAPASSPDSPFPLPRVTIRYCTQCKWMLRAAYFAQELLSTFSTTLGEVALQPATGGTFIVDITFREPSPSSSSSSPTPAIQNRVLWDRKADGGFPETKELKRRVRDAVEPGRDLGHVDRHHPRQAQPQPAETTAGASKGRAEEDENALGLHTQPGPIGGPACGPGTESVRVNAATTQEECEDCK